MKKICLWCWLLTKRQLKNIMFLFILLLIPVTAFITSRIEGFHEPEALFVALYARDDDEMAADTIKNLLADTDTYCFYLCGSEEELMQDVQNGKAECGYIFGENITERVTEEKYKNNIIQVKKKGSFIADSVNETVFCSFFRFFTKNMILEYVKNNEKFAGMDPEGLLQLSGAFDSYLTGNQTFHVAFRVLGGGENFAETKVLEAESASFPLRNIMAVLMMTGALLGVLSWLSDRENGVFAPMKYDFVAISRILYVLIPTVLLAICSLCGMAAARTITSAGREILVMLAYVILLTAAGTIATCFVNRSTWIVSAFPVLVIGSLILCPVFIDLSVYIPGIQYVQRLFLPYYYMTMF